MLWRAALSALLTVVALVVLWRRKPERERALVWARRLERGGLTRARGEVRLAGDSVAVWSSGQPAAYAEIVIAEDGSSLDDDVERIPLTRGIHSRQVAAVAAFEVVGDEGAWRVPLGEGSLVLPVVRAVTPSERTAQKMPSLVGENARPVYHEGTIGPGTRVVVHGRLAADDEGAFRRAPGARGFAGPVLVVDASLEAQVRGALEAVPRSRVTAVRVVATVAIGVFGGGIALLLAAVEAGW